MKNRMRGFDIDFIEKVLPDIKHSHQGWSNEKIIYFLSWDKIIWWTPIKFVNIKNKIISINGRYVKALIRFIDGSEKELYIDQKYVKREETTDSKYKKEFYDIMKDVEDQNG